jgi:hypothetical protein
MSQGVGKGEREGEGGGAAGKGKRGREGWKGRKGGLERGKWIK